MPKIFASDAVHNERLIFGSSPQKIGLRLRNWKQLSVLYQESFAACGYQVERLVRPEIYQTDMARKVLGVISGDWHLVVKPIEHIRPFHGIPNVFVCNWPFPEISASSYGVSPFLNHLGLLKRADAIVCCTDFTAQSLLNAGVERVITLPPYIPKMSGKEIASVPFRMPGHQVFLSIASSPRQFHPILNGFLQAKLKCHNIHLAVWVPSIDQDLGHELRQMIGSEIDNAVSLYPVNMCFTDLLKTTDFFLHGNLADGLPVSLVSAMLAQVPIVTTMHSGIESFLSSGSAVSIATSTASVEKDDEPLAFSMHLTCYPPTAKGVYEAVIAAVGLSMENRFKMINKAREIADQNFGLEAFKAGLAKLERMVALRQQ